MNQCCCCLTQGDPYQKQRIKLGGLVETRDTIRRSRRIMFVACGTSYHAALAARQTVRKLLLCSGSIHACTWLCWNDKHGSFCRQLILLTDV
jgi:glucosamine 6-phosphate synthetase-like amidotransferase/phosphosugar isomerase protein